MDMNVIELDEQDYKEALERLQDELASWQTFWTLVQKNGDKFTDEEIAQLKTVADEFKDYCDKMSLILLPIEAHA